MAAWVRTWPMISQFFHPVVWNNLLVIDPGSSVDMQREIWSPHKSLPFQHGEDLHPFFCWALHNLLEVFGFRSTWCNMGPLPLWHFFSKCERIFFYKTNHRNSVTLFLYWSMRTVRGSDTCTVDTPMHLQCFCCRCCLLYGSRSLGLDELSLHC